MQKTKYKIFNGENIIRQQHKNIKTLKLTRHVPFLYIDFIFVKIAQVTQPKYRYRVGNDSKYLVTALNMMHESSQDALWMYPSLKSSDAHPAAAPEDGAAEAKARYRSDWSRTLLLAALGFMGYRAVSRL